MNEETTLTFTVFSPAYYRTFLRAKLLPEFRMTLDGNGLANGFAFPSRFAHLVGAPEQIPQRNMLPLPKFLFDDQAAIVKWMIQIKRGASWKDCGLGKTLEELEWSRQVMHLTKKRVLLVTMGEIVNQIMAEAAKFYGGGDELPMLRLETRKQMRDWCAGRAGGPMLGITNYEKFNPEDGEQIIPEIKHLGGLGLDESSRLKTGGGKQKWAIIKSSRGVEYKGSWTGTPAPNEVMEFASQASFLERIRDENDVIWTYFTRDKNNEWTVKKYARGAFFRWMASWSIYVQDPRRYGWRAGAPGVPKPHFFIEPIPATPEQMQLYHASQAAASEGQLDLLAQRRFGLVTQSQLLEAAKGFVYKAGDNTKWDLVPSFKLEWVAQKAKEQFLAGRQTLIWCDYRAEAELICRRLAQLGISAQPLTGLTKKSDRATILERFRNGDLPLMVAMSKLVSFGQNFQKCVSQIHSGINDSFEQFYQQVRRSYRHGAAETLHVFMPFVKELEGPVFDNRMVKAARFEELIKEQECAYLAARKELHD